MRSLRSAELRGRGLVVAALLGIAVMFITATITITQTDREILRGLGPQEGYYWTVAQYQIAYLRARDAIHRTALGAKEHDNELERLVSVLMSKESVLTADSELTSFFKEVPGYPEASRVITEFHRRVDPMMDTPASVHAHAADLVQEFDDIEGTILRLASEVRIEEIETRGVTIEGLLLRRRLLWGFMWSVFVVLLLWVWSVSASWSRYSKAARAREAALDAERAAVTAKTQFLGMVSHELRSPLQSIVLSLDQLEANRVLPEQAELTKSIRRAANELSVQLRDLLTLARGQSGRIELRPEVFEACELVREAVEAERPQALANGLALSAELVPNELFVVADAARIGQVLHNLIDNAVRYAQRGSVRVRLEGFSTETSALRLVVSDTGPGLPAQAVVSVTDGIDAAAAGTPERGVRRGLGLAIVRALIKQLGGSLSVGTIVEPAPSHGTTFTLLIPAVLAGDRPPSMRSGEGRVLIVDDRPELLVGFAQVGAELGLQCDTAASAAMALNLLAAHPYATVLIDLNMPDTSGSELAVEIRNGFNRDAYLVGMTANAEVERSELLPFDAVLEKPIDRGRLQAAIAVRRRSSAQPQ